MPPRHPTVIAYHLVWTAYGTWLPNDPRGSGSHAVATPQLAELGPLHFGRKKTQPAPAQVRAFYERAAEKLLYPVLHFDRLQIRAIAGAFADTIHEHSYTCYACAILPDHVHLLIRKHRHRAETMIEHFQTDSRARLLDACTIERDHPVWTQGGWRSFLDAPSGVRTVIRYVQRNPPKSALPPQQWPFIAPYDGWPFHHRQPSFAQ